MAAEAELIRRPIDDDGLVGTLMVPRIGGQRPLPVILTLGGSEGGLHEDAARTFTGEGFAAVALAYFGVDPLPEELVEIPLEYFGRVLTWLGRQPEVDATRVGVVGGSSGELALLLGATYPEDIKAVVAYVPSGVAWQCIIDDRRAMRAGPTSSWSHLGQPVTFLRYARPTVRQMFRFIDYSLGRPMEIRPVYERALRDQAAVDAATIPVGAGQRTGAVHQWNG